MVCINVSNPPVEFPLSLSASLLLSGTPIPGNAGKYLSALVVVLLVVLAISTYSEISVMGINIIIYTM